MALTDKLTAIADAIRAQSGKTAKIPLAQMPNEILGIQPLNFEVVGNPKPQNPKANTIWMNIDNVSGWECGATEPTATDTWVKTGKASPYAFNALKDNSIIVYPLCGLRRVSGEWKYVDAEIYQNGWHELLPEVALFDNGILNTDVFGGLVNDNDYHNVSISNGVMSFDQYTSTNTSKLFDVTAFSTISVEIRAYGYTHIALKLTDENGKSFVPVKSGNDADGGTLTFDISECTGKRYLKLTGSGNANAKSTTVSSIKFKA